MLEITVEDPARLLGLLDEVDRVVEASAAERSRLDAVLEAGAREVPEADLVRAVDAAARSGEAPRSVRALADRVARLDLTWDDVLDLQRPARDADVAAARADLVADGLAHLRQLDLQIDVDELERAELEGSDR